MYVLILLFLGFVALILILARFGKIGQKIAVYTVLVVIAAIMIIPF